jgi:DNA-binding transcriptional regulator LsrR (DeoR family)
MADEIIAHKIYKEADRRRLLIHVAKLYYNENLSQNEIAEQISVSRSNISKMLQSARDMKIVEIHINETTTEGIELGNELTRTFDLNFAEVVPFTPDQEELKTAMGKAAARYLEDRLENSTTIGISWGSTLYQVVEHLRPKPSTRIDVVQLMGGIGARNLSIDGVQLAYKLSEKLGGRCIVIHAPLFVQNREAKEILLKEPEIARAVKAAGGVDLALLGIGSSFPESSALIRAGYISKQETEIIRRQGAVGNILGRQITVHGELCPIEMNDKVIGLDTEGLTKIPLRIGVAGGSDKADVILGTLRKGFINGLITDESAAFKILSIHREAENGEKGR